MRILVVHPGPHFSVADVYTGWLEALPQLGHVVHPYNLGDRLIFYDSAMLECTGTALLPGQLPTGNLQFRKALDREDVLAMAADKILATAFKFWPDVVLIVSAFYIPTLFMDIIRARPGTVSGRKMKVVLLHTEAPYQDDEQLARAAHADLNLLNDPVNLQAYRDLGVPAHYMPHAYRPAIHNPGPGLPEYQTDFAFVGTGFPSRCEFFERMIKSGHLDHLDVTLGGNWQASGEGSVLREHLAHDLTACVDNETTALIYRSARAGINFYRRESEDEHSGEGWAVGPREVEMAACGLWFTRDPRGESDELFPMLPTFTGPEDAAEQVAWHIAHEAEREKAALAARAAIRDRTFLNSAKTLTQYLDEL